MKAMRICLAFCSGRRLLIPVVEMLVGRLRALGHPDRFDLRLLVVWDRAFEGEAPPAEALQRVGGGVFVRVRCVEDDEGDGPSWLPRVRGYAALRNRAVLEAARDDADAVLFLDDDEYYAAPWRDGDGRLRWLPVDPLGPHVRGWALGADVTNGYTLGEPSPIPRGLPDRVAPSLLRQLGRALAPGSEFLEEETFLRGRLRLASGPTPPRLRRVSQRDGVPRLSGGNLGLNLASLRQGRLPPFFTPPFARGEDALFGARLGHLRVLRVPAFVYHDPFRRHVDIPAGVRPRSLSPASLTAATAERFGRALLGWVRYAPLLLRLRQGATDDLALDDLHRVLTTAAPRLMAGLGWEGFTVLPTAMARCRRRCAEDLALMQRQEEAWRDALTHPVVSERPADIRRAA